jgi:imidazoleglycerol-phosphate dehydratase
MVKVARKTKETRIELQLRRAASPPRGVVVSTTLPFFDHMLATLLRYAGVDGEVQATGDLSHHIVEDVAIAIGRAVRELVPPTCARYGERTIPMDDALVHAAIDVGGRYYFAGRVPNALHTHAMRSFAEHLGATLHVRILAGRDRHHLIEAGWKAIGLSLRDAMVEGDSLFSTKGSVEWSIEQEAAAPDPSAPDEREA